MSLDTVGTPPHIVAALARDLGRPFKLDVCAEAWSAKAPHFYAPPQDGLALPWASENFLNPVYAVQEAWMQRAAREATQHGNTTAALVRAAQDARYWFRLATSRATTDFIVGRLSFIAPPEGVTIRQKVKGVVRERFIPGGDPIKGADFASAVLWYGPDFKPGVVRWRDADTGELIDVRRAHELRGLEAFHDHGF